MIQASEEAHSAVNRDEKRDGRLASIDLNMLYAFDALMAERNVTRAALIVGVRQPALSATLSRLRRTLSDPLFVREGQRLVPTPVAESLAGPVSAALKGAQAIIDGRRSFDPVRDKRQFTVLASDYVSVILLHPLLARLKSESPDVEMNVRPIAPDFADRLRRGQADLVVMPAELVSSMDGLQAEALFTDRNVCVVDAARTDLGDQISLDALASAALLTYEGGTLGTVSAEISGRQSVGHEFDVSTQSFMVGAFMVVRTRMIALLPSRLISKLAGPANIRIVETPTHMPDFVETMFWSERTAGDPAIRWLRAQLALSAAAMDERPVS